MATTEGTRRIPDWTLGERLEKARKDAGLKQDDLAMILGVSPATISNWETGARRPRQGELELVNKWAEETCVDVAWLLGVRIGCFSPDPIDGKAAYLDNFPKVVMGSDRGLVPAA